MLGDGVKYWIVFGTVQVVGAVLPWFGNVHSNIMPVLLSALLLIPGSIVASHPAFERLHVAAQFAFVFSLNLLVWYLIKKLLRIGEGPSDPQTGN